jgi:hypothetical protein
MTKKEIIPSRYRMVKKGALDKLVMSFASRHARKPVKKKRVSSNTEGTKNIAGMKGGRVEDPQA